MAEYYSMVCVFHTFFIHASVNGQSVCSHVLTLVNKAARDTGMCISLQDSGSISFAYVLRSGIAVSY